MRYVRFLKPPRVVHDKTRTSAHVACLVTITSDLGDSFLPYSLTLSAELIQDERLTSDTGLEPDLDADTQLPPSEALLSSNNVKAWKTVQWKEGMRSLPVTFPLSRNYEQNGALVVRIGTEPKSDSDDFHRMLLGDSCGVVSVWSAPFNLPRSAPVSRTVERRFKIGPRTHRIFEETGESIARHVWDAGVALSCQLPCLLEDSGIIKEILADHRRRQGRAHALPQSARSEPPLHVIELGSGCGMVSVVLSHLVATVEISVTDLAEAQAIAVQNIRHAGRNRKNRAMLAFHELDWEQPLFEGETVLRDSLDGAPPERVVDLVVAADCTYNADSSPAFVNTIYQIALQFPYVTVAVAMKKRHASEDVFFSLMSKANFRIANSISFPLPGDQIAEKYPFTRPI
ncbi:hypothetical protein P171DRAFT_524252 [Karstenula rhodostoma CBS 690.94]|uniref:Uncharacterized protein n=1 Tax=Karstenula rhodostoma CBS 690.94 TaxID=1392251 RepID=A0A9P4PE00_9PLEO|nr:hypothetical protein P171DRAFT_524252 [Karstenula rhodostoma CBS 690.94]